jgi:hypothetical protein
MQRMEYNQELIAGVKAALSPFPRHVPASSGNGRSPGLMAAGLAWLTPGSEQPPRGGSLTPAFRLPCPS